MKTIDVAREIHRGVLNEGWDVTDVDEMLMDLMEETKKKVIKDINIACFDALNSIKGDDKLTFLSKTGIIALNKEAKQNKNCKTTNQFLCGKCYWSVWARDKDKVYICNYHETELTEQITRCEAYWEMPMEVE